MRKKVVMVLLACMLTSSMVLTSCGQKAATDKQAGKQTEATRQYTEEDLKDVIVGLEDHYILQDAKDIDYLYGVSYDTDIIKEVKADADKVKLDKTGKYTVTYTVTVDTDALEKYFAEKKEDKKESEDTDSADSTEKPEDSEKTEDTSSGEDEKQESEKKDEESSDSSKDSKEESKEDPEESKDETDKKSDEEEKTEDKTEDKSDAKDESGSEEKEEDKKEPSKDSGDKTVDVKVDKDMTVVDKDEAKDLADKDETVWGDKNEPVEKSDGTEVKEEEKVPESTESKSDSKADPKSDIKKEDTKKNDTESGSSSSGSTNNSSSSSGSASSGSSSGSQTQQPSKPAHTHTRVAHYKTVTKQTGQEWVSNLVKVGSKTVCNGCGADITGNIEHTFEEKCGYHSEPIYEDQGWYEPVYSQVQEIDYYYCSSCGARL